MKDVTIKKGSFIRGAWARYRKNVPALIGLIIVGVVIFLAVFADVLAPYEEMALEQNPDARFLGPSLEHLLGTDAFGRDSFARLIHGARWSLGFGFLGATLVFGFGCVLGAAMALIGGKFDEVMTRVLDVLLSIPSSILLVSLVVLSGRSFGSLLIAMVVPGIPGGARLCRTVFLSIVSQSYIETARANGCTPARVLFHHVIPNALSILMIQYSTQVASMVVAAAGFSYLGLGIQPPTPEWGSMLSEAQTYLRTYPNAVIWPGIVISLITVALSLIGNGMSEALDPQMKE